MSSFIGTWKLKSCEHRLQNGEIFYPLGEAAGGILVYSADGWMSVILMKAGRPLFKTTGLFEGSPSEKISAVEGYVSYAGRFEILKEKVIHHVEFSLFPNWVGTAQERFYKFEKNKLLLFTPPFVMNGQEQSAYLVWERA